MLKRLFIAVSFFTPLASHANCSVFDSNTQTLNVHTRVAKEEKVTCNASAGLSNSSPLSDSAQNPAYRRSNTEKLRAFTDLKRQSEYLSNTQHYYGQK